MSRRTATLIGFTAILAWSVLALLTIGAAPVPPLMLNAICFGIGCGIGLIWMARRGFGTLRHIPLPVYALGAFALFGYHFVYFTAFRISPSAATGLIAYLWPLLIVLFSAFLPQETLRLRHVIGALIAFAGAAIVVLGSGPIAAKPSALALAFLCALIWSIYSVASRKWGNVPSEAVTVYCGAAAILSAIGHVLFEQTQWPQGALGWASVLALGAGPLGLAFFTWDIGVKKGNIQLLGVASFAAPLLSTVVLVAAGHTDPSLSLALAALMITLGAAIAAYAPHQTINPKG
jgi:drug/metabolite transporter (DMT)-like permease